MTKPMTKHRLAQYIKLKREIVMLDEQIYTAGDKGDYVTDVVRGSARRLPYAMHDIVIKGYGSQDVPRLSARKTACIAECKEIEKFIENLEDSIMRQMLAWRYIEGYGAEESAKLVGYSRRQANRLINNLFEKLSADVPLCP